MASHWRFQIDYLFLFLSCKNKVCRFQNISTFWWAKETRTFFLRSSIIPKNSNQHPHIILQDQRGTLCFLNDDAFTKRLPLAGNAVDSLSFPGLLGSKQKEDWIYGMVGRLYEISFWSHWKSSRIAGLLFSLEWSAKTHNNDGRIKPKLLFLPSQLPPSLPDMYQFITCESERMFEF